MKTVEETPNSEPELADTPKKVLPSSVDIHQNNSLRRHAISATGTIFLVGAIFAGFFTLRYTKSTAQGQAAPVEIRGSSEDYMRQRNHGTCVSPVGDPLRWDVDVAKADQICCFNRHFAERKGSWTGSSFFDDTKDATSETVFYDSVTEKKLFTAPVGRTREEFEEESIHHGWPSFRDAEVDMENVRVLENGEVVSVDGTHLGHNLPDEDGNRYCINLISVAGMPPTNDTLALIREPADSF